MHILPLILDYLQVKRGLDGKDPRRVFLVDNFRHLGGGVIHTNFSAAYLVNPNASLGKYPNDLVHLRCFSYFHCNPISSVYRHLKEQYSSL